MGGQKNKKKKPAANPARGFATTSIASKPKQKSEPESGNESSVKDSQNVSSTATPAKAASEPSKHVEDGQRKEKELHELSPEELEQRLEETELQNLVEKISTKTKRDSSRCVNKLQTDCRLLRANAHQSVQTKNYLPPEVTQQILGLAAEDVSKGRYFALETGNESRKRKRLPEDDTTAKLWTLESVLLALGFTKDGVREALRHVLDYPPLVDSESFGGIWGLDECLDWLVLNVEEDKLPLYDTQTGKPREGILERDNPEEDPERDDSPEREHSTSQPNGDDQAASNEAAEIDVSDLDSDMEPDELLSSYLSTKATLYDIQPDLIDGRSQKKWKQNKGGNKQADSSPSVSLTTPGVKRLQQKLSRIESDGLFDKREADAQWVARRNELAREQAERRKLNLPDREPQESEDQSSNAERQSLSQSTTFPGSDNVLDDGAAEDDNALGDLFSAEPAEAQQLQPAPASQTEESSNIKIVDFGQSKGMEPRRVLEETCRSRDPSVKISYRLLSKSAFSNRHDVRIFWSKDQTFSYPLQSEPVSSRWRLRSCTFTMNSLATPESTQSLAYISVFALFQMFSTSTREDKAYLRLPPNWRNLWSDLSEQSKSQHEAEERTNARALRDLVRQYNDDNDADEVVHTKNFRNRAEGMKQGNGDIDTPDINKNVDSEALQSMWNAKSSSQAYSRMLQLRSQLPMWQFKDQALAAIEQNQVTIVCGETGCGKSTQMPSYILQQELSHGRECKVYCTEPRRISAITLAQRVSEELGENKKDLGTNRSLVGYAIRLESQVASSTRLVYATTGIVLRMLESNESLTEITHIIIDEVHERSIETDFLLIILRSLISKRPSLKVILMSATVDAARFQRYFGSAPALHVPGRTFPVQTQFLEDAIELTGHVVDADDQIKEEEDAEADETSSNSTTAQIDPNLYSARTRRTLSKYNEYQIDYALILRLVENVHKHPQYSQFNQAILVFLPGIAEIRRMADTLSGSSLGRTYQIHTLHSSIASEDQQRAFAHPPRGKGKIVLSTNIAETGVTIPDITCVIDTGTHKEMRFDEKKQISRLVQSFISRANAKQRRGRAGRVQEGLCFHLFTKPRHDHTLAEQQTPEMLRLSLQDLIMRVKICKLGDIQSTLAEALDPPSAKNIQRAIDTLIEVGALTSGENLTALGQQLSKLPLDPYLGKLVLFGSLFSCLDTTLTLAAILTSKSAFVAPVGAQKQADVARLAFRKGDSDLLTEYNAYSAWRRICTSGSMSEHEFSRRNFLSLQTLANIEDLKSQLLSSLAEAGFVKLTASERSGSNRNMHARRFIAIPSHTTSNDTDANPALVSTVIAWSFYPKILMRDGKGWRNIATNQSVNLHPTSIIRQVLSSGGSAGLSTPNMRFLSFYSILQSSGGAKNYNANSLTPLHPLPLLLLAGTTSSFHPTAHTITLDNSRLRFTLMDYLSSTTTASSAATTMPTTGGAGTAGNTGGDRAHQSAWRTLVAIKFMRRRLEECVRWRWKNGGGVGGGDGSGGGGGGSGTGANNDVSPRLPARLEKWNTLWQQLSSAWAEGNAAATAAPPRDGSGSGKVAMVGASK
ncbi:MAG: hypothetical protein M1831_001188 [Alyxoria varia]|nr:MAG: hypothetical protein M1831_001188 [Alyxoria varia]